MDQGKNYEVYYHDGDITRHKTLKFLKTEHGLCEFANSQTNRIDIIPTSRIVRIEESRDQGAWKATASQSPSA